MASPSTRLAPSPTGALHLGNARTFLINWLIARQRGLKLSLRIEDLDGPRIKRGADVDAIADLDWLGIDWDSQPIYQSTRTEIYQSAVHRLIEEGHAYPCICTRREAQLAASAPHLEDGLTIYPGTCRGRFRSVAQARDESGREPAIRFRVTDRVIQFEDAFAGVRRFDAARELGDFVIMKADGTAAYQLAVVVDDAAMGITDVIRGDDLIDSTPRQIILFEALGMSDRLPQYMHLPLVIGEDGKRLAKRHGDTRISHYRRRGVSAARMRALLARWSGVQQVGEEITMIDLLDRFSLAAVPRTPIIFCPAEDAWLLADAKDA